MKEGHLSQYFDGIAFKVLTAVEVDALSSNQHEFNGVEGLREILGEPDGKERYLARFLYLTDDEEKLVNEEGFLTWYDARQKARVERGVMRREYRLYFPSNSVLESANAGDFLFLAKQPDGGLLAIVAEQSTTIASQLIWLFGVSDSGYAGFSIRSRLDGERDRVQFSSRYILESIGVPVDVSMDAHLEQMLNKFSGAFPSTREFSSFARSTLSGINPLDDYDAVLMAWLEREELLFRALEKHVIGERLSMGFDGDVDGFISFSLSVQNRRKSRAGLSLENHLEEIFKSAKVRYVRTPVTENKSKPDFLFPSAEKYRDPTFNEELLTMLGVKSSCKDRWRQVLSEAERIKNKHLLTLEAAISKSQTDEMQVRGLQLVLPKSLHETYSVSQRSWLMNVVDFVDLVQVRQASD
jgi:hypothetical protein